MDVKYASAGRGVLEITRRRKTVDRIATGTADNS